jgi:hypothetical protein
VTRCSPIAAAFTSERVKTVKRITKLQWYAAGGLSNPKLYRRMSASGVWLYYREG